jgi:hypothetical protein
MTTRARNLMFLALLVVIGGVGLYFGTPKPRPAADNLLSAVPRNAWLIATLDLDALRASPFGAALGIGADAGPGTPTASGTAGDVLGVSKLQQLCGFDPLARVHRAVIAAPEGGDKGEFGIAATGEIAKADFVACAQSAIKGRGGSAMVATRGDFTLVEDVASPGGARVAVREGGPVIVGRGTWLEAMMDAVEGKAPRASDDPSHGQIRAVLEGKLKSPAIVVTALLPASLREKLKHEMTTTPDGGTNVEMVGVLDVDTAGVAVTPGTSAQDAQADMELHCATADGCVAVKRLLEQQRLALSQSFAVRALALGPLVDSLVIEGSGTSLSARAHAPADALVAALRRAIEWRNLRAPQPPQPPQPPPGR